MSNRTIYVANVAIDLSTLQYSKIEMMQTMIHKEIARRNAPDPRTRSGKKRLRDPEPLESEPDEEDSDSDSAIGTDGALVKERNKYSCPRAYLAKFMYLGNFTIEFVDAQRLEREGKEKTHGWEHYLVVPTRNNAAGKKQVHYRFGSAFCEIGFVRNETTGLYFRWLHVDKVARFLDTQTLFERDDQEKQTPVVECDDLLSL